MKRTTLKDITGQKFGMLTVISRAETKNSQAYWNCTCDCGKTRIAAGGALRSGEAKSCGCTRFKVSTKTYTHNSKLREYGIWNSMKMRCHNPRATSYKFYGAKGITVCTRWHTFENFYSDMGPCPDGMTLDRINPKKNYCKSNCRWTTNEVQGNNRGNCVKIKHYGETKTLAQWARDPRCVVNPSTFRIRISILGWKIDKALNTPARPRLIKHLLDK